MKEINLQSAFLVSSLFHFTLAFLVWFLLKGKKSKEISIWSIGSMIIFLGAAFLGLRDLISDHLSYGVSRTCTIVGGIFLISAYKMHLSEEFNLKKGIYIGLSIGAFIELSRLYIDTPKLHFLLNILAYLIITLYLFYITHRIGTKNNSYAAHIISYSFIIMGINYSIRINDILSGEFTGNISSSTTGNVIQLITSAIYNTIAGVCYTIIWKDRSEKRELETFKLHEKEVDSRLLERKIFHLERQKSLGEISAMISHEISQPLTVIRSIGEVGRLLLKSDTLDKEKLAEAFNDIARNATRCSQILKRVKQFSKPDQNLKSIQDIRITIDESIDLLNLDFKSAKIFIKKHQPNSAIYVKCDPIRISQVFVNIMKNAIDSIKESSNATLEVSIKITTQEGNVTVEFIDSGIGFSPSIIKQVGTAFFTTKTDGLGLGLSIAYNIIEEHGGSIVIANHVSGGASVSIKLPITAT